MGTVQITQAQIVGQWKAELTNLERQIAAGENAITLLREAQLSLRVDDMQGSIEKALDMMIGAQLCTSLLSMEMMKERKTQLQDGIKQAESPITRVKLER